MNQPAPIVPTGARIENESFHHIDTHTVNTHGYDTHQWSLVRRLIHTNGDFDFNGITQFHPRAIAAGVTAIRRGAPLVVDVKMIQAGLTERRLKPFNLVVHQFISDQDVIDLAISEATSRAVQAMRKAYRLGLLDGAIVGVGNAPTALLEILRLVREQAARPALIVGIPVGFIAASESKQALSHEQNIPWITALGTKGGSPLAVAALHALIDLAATDVCYDHAQA